MLRRLSFKKLLPSLPRNYWLNKINQMSNDSMQDNDNNCEVLNADKPVEDISHRSYNRKEVLHLLKEAATFKDADNKDWMTMPYPADTRIVKEEETNLKREPDNTFVLIFPGQGSIQVGMIKKYMQYPAAKELFDTASAITNFDLLNLCMNGPQETLNRTEFNQAATVVSSLAALEKIRAECPQVFENCVATAGYSVGEITALILSGAINFEDGVRLVWTRGKAMQNAANRVPQGMMAVTCTRNAEVSKACTEAVMWAMNMGVENPVCKVAIFLYTEKKILAGNIEALEYIQRHKKQFGLTNVTKLPVSGAFHTPLMEPALKLVSKTLDMIELNEPRCKVYSNYKGLPYTDLYRMKKYLLKQIVSPVKWEQCMQHIYQRPEGTLFPCTYDVGSEGRMRIILKLINTKAYRYCTAI